MKKRIIGLVIVLILLVAATTASALSAQPGNTVQIPITLNNTDGCYVAISVSYDTSVFDYVSIQCPSGQATGTTMTMSQTSILPSGVCGTLTLKVKDSATNGTYSIKANVTECCNIDEDYGKASASAESITITGGACAHANAEWINTKEATCTAAGEKIYKCKSCYATLKTEAIPATGHDEGTWKTTEEATCTAAGEKALVCGKCGETLKTEAIPATGHDEGEWVVTKKATYEAEGEKQLQCTKCDAVLETAVIPKATIKYFDNQYVCTVGLRFRDYSDINQRRMFTPLDLSQDGEYLVDLIANNSHKVGTLTVAVEGDKVTVSCEMVNKYIKIHDEFFTFFPRVNDVSSVNPADLSGYAFDQEISIANDLNGDTKVIIYYWGHVSYNSSMANIWWYSTTNSAYKALVSELELLMD